MLHSTMAIERRLNHFEQNAEVALAALRSAVLNGKLTLAAFFHTALAIDRNQTLITIDLSKLLGSNRIKANPSAQINVFQSIAREILKAKELRIIILDDASISEEAAKALAVGLRETSIEKVSLACCDFASAASVFTVIEAAASNPKIKCINLFGSITFEDLESLRQLKGWMNILDDKLIVDSVTSEICAGVRSKIPLAEMEQKLVQLEIDWNVPTAPIRTSALVMEQKKIPEEVDEKAEAKETKKDAPASSSAKPSFELSRYRLNAHLQPKKSSQSPATDSRPSTLKKGAR